MRQAPSIVEGSYREMSSAAFPWWLWSPRTDIVIGTPTRGEARLAADWIRHHALRMRE
jgi:hypothetical protein